MKKRTKKPPVTPESKRDSVNEDSYYEQHDNGCDNVDDEAEQQGGQEGTNGDDEVEQQGEQEGNKDDDDERDDDDDGKEDDCPTLNTLDRKDARQWASLFEMMDLFVTLSLEKDEQCSRITDAIKQYNTVKDSEMEKNICQMELCNKKCHNSTFFCQVHLSQFIASHREEDKHATVTAVLNLHKDNDYEEHQRALYLTKKFGEGADEESLGDDYKDDYKDSTRPKNRFIDDMAGVEKVDLDEMDDLVEMDEVEQVEEKSCSSLEVEQVEEKSCSSLEVEQVEEKSCSSLEPYFRLSELDANDEFSVFLKELCDSPELIN